MLAQVYIISFGEREMSILEAVFCGVVQGACEFLPVSSSGHLALLHGLFGISVGGDDLAFDVMLHLGTLFAVLIAYRKDLAPLVRAFFGAARKILKKEFASAAPEEKTALYLALATLPLAAAAFLGDGASALARYPKITGAMLVLNGVMLVVGGRFGRKTKKCHELSPTGALGTGLFQLFAVIPGISRSGSTITGGEIFGLKTEEAVRFSFLLSIPAIIGANAFEAVDVIKSGASVPLAACAVGTVTAALVGFLAIGIIKKLAKKRNFNIFGIYCIAVGAFAVLYG